MNSFMKHKFNFKYQSGVALPIGLMLLLVVTVIGISSFQTTVMEERMSGNMRKRSVALQVAEAALRAGEREIVNKNNIHRLVFYNNGTDDNNKIVDNDGDLCGENSGGISNGYCTPAKHDELFDATLAPGQSGYLYERWEDISKSGSLDVWNDPDRHITYSENVTGDIAVDAKYIIEFVGYIPGGPIDPVLGRPVSACDTDRDGVPDNPPTAIDWPWCQSDLPMYRISALAETDDSTRVMLQSTFKHGTL